jgi:hypothetical protein
VPRGPREHLADVEVDGDPRLAQLLDAFGEHEFGRVRCGRFLPGEGRLCLAFFLALVAPRDHVREALEDVQRLAVAKRTEGAVRGGLHICVLRIGQECVQVGARRTDLDVRIVSQLRQER